MITRKNEQTLNLREHMRGGNGTVEITNLSKELPDNARLFGKIVLHPGASIGYHVHEKETELFYFAEGSGVVTDDDQKIAICAGDSMETCSGHGHAVENTGSSDLVLWATIVKDPV